MRDYEFKPPVVQIFRPVPLRVFSVTRVLGASRAFLALIERSSKFAGRTFTTGVFLFNFKGHPNPMSLSPFFLGGIPVAHIPVQRTFSPNPRSLSIPGKKCRSALGSHRSDGRNT